MCAPFPLIVSLYSLLWWATHVQLVITTISHVEHMSWTFNDLYTLVYNIQLLTAYAAVRVCTRLPFEQSTIVQPTWTILYFRPHTDLLVSQLD